MARGHDGYFGETFESWYIWLPLCVLFLFPFFDPRRPFRILHLDLLVLVAGFGVSHFFFNQGEIGTSVPLVYPVLAYFLGRMLVAAFRPRRSAGPLVPIVPAAFLVAGIVLLGGFRIGLDLTSGRVGDVGYGSAVGAYRIQKDEPLYVDSGRNDQHFDTYGPVNYLAYDPFVRVLEPTEQQLQASANYDAAGRPRGRARVRRAHDHRAVPARPAAAGRGRAGRLLGLALAYGWVSFPYTLFPLMTNGNDTLISMFVVYALLALTSTPARGALIALAGAAKFAPLALAPLFATGRGDGSRLRSWISFGMVFAFVVLVAVVPYIPADGGLRVFYDQTIGFQLDRESPFSVWGQNSGLEPAALAREGGGGRPRRRGGVRPPQARHPPGRRARRRGADRDAAHRGPLVLPLHRVVRPVPARGAVRRILDRARARVRSAGGDRLAAAGAGRAGGRPGKRLGLALGAVQSVAAVERA